jgi:hypothetical protein
MWREGSIFFKRHPLIFALFLLFLMLGLFGILPTLVLTWKSTEGWPNPIEVALTIWTLDQPAKWHQVLAIATVSLACATLIVGLVGFFAFIAAIYHVERAERASRADLLLNLERQAMSPGMIEAQHELLELFSSSWKAIRDHSEDLTHDEMIRKISAICQAKLAELRNKDDKRYHLLFRNCEFLETVGIMVKQGYVDIEDVVSRFEVGIERVHACFDLHLKERRNESWASDLFFQHISELYDKVRMLRERKAA